MSSYYTQNNLTIASLRIVLIVKTDISKFIKSFIKPAFTVVSIQEFIDILNEYLIWYNEKQIKISLGNMSPLEWLGGLASPRKCPHPQSCILSCNMAFWLFYYSTIVATRPEPVALAPSRYLNTILPWILYDFRN